KKRKITDAYLGLRNQVLSLDPVQIGFQSDKDNSPLYGILMETGYSDAVATFVAIGDGAVSLYFSNGGGIIGLGEYEGPRKACFSFLSYAEQFISQLRPTKEFPLPQKGQTIFYFLTVNGVLTAEAKEKDLGNDRAELSPLFHKAHDVITQARLVEEERARDFSELMHAVTAGDLNKLESLVEKGIDIKMSDREGLTPVMLASYNGKVDILKKLLNEDVPVDSKDASGYTALMYACKSDNLECSKVLIENGSAVNHVDNDGSTPLMFCSQHGYNDIVTLLLEKGADPTITGKHGLLAIDLAKQNGFEETEKILKTACNKFI
ncbi:ankyrin repeat domain-containing protein, partial [bacterium]|nr:ankyrin repeat domain-containing protein [bacterium]MBU1918950.1 ankyrin repeat domain-containing protein [bacterium]